MQRYTTLLRLTLVISLFLLTAIGASAQGDFVRASVRSVTGIAMISAGPQSGAFALKRNAIIEPGNIIKTGQNGRVVISLSDGGGQITVLPNSKVVLKNFRDVQNVRELLEIMVGRVLVKIHHIGGKPNPYRLSSPAASIAVRGTEFIVDVQSGGETLVLVREGLVEVWSRNNPDNKRLVTPGSRVIVRPGGDISLALPGPGSELNGRSRLNGGLGEDYQRSVDSMAQNSNEVPPVFFSAFPDQHLDSLENPAYATGFEKAEGRLLLLPSISMPYNYHSDDTKDQPLFNYSISPQLTFFTPIPGSRLVVGGGASAFGVRSQDLSDYQFLANTGHYREDLRFNASSVSFIAAYSFGDRGKTSVGIGIDRLSGDGSFFSESIYSTNTFYNGYFDNSKARFARTRLTIGLARRFSGGKNLGLYYRHGINTSDQENQSRQEYDSDSLPKTVSFTDGKTNISNVASEIGARFRASLTRRLFYGVEGSYLYERINSRREPLNWTTAFNRYHYLARRARLGAGLGFALTSKILLDFDATGGVFNNGRPPEEPINSSGNFFSYSSSPGSLRSVGGTSISAHAAVQTNLWRGLLLSASSLKTVRRDLFYEQVITYRYLYTFSDGTPAYEPVESYRPNKVTDTNRLTSISIGWKFKPNFITEYLYSYDQRYQGASHSFNIRYTFNLGITGEK
ncbi:MAG TPA: FecR family protein [Blastocatellia bacterium]|nr:FecR family protein [Blastocatellia bacterium]